MQNKRAPEADLLKFFSTVKEGLTGAYRLGRALPAFFREQIIVPRAEEEIKRMLASREERFLELARSRIYAYPESPYLRLLKIAGCEFADLQAQVNRDGLEKTLERLATQGVYLTSDEFKGKKEVVRGGQSFLVFPENFQRRDSAPGFITQSSGTGSRPTRSLVALDWLALRALSTCVLFSAHDLFACSHALCDAMLPGSGGINNVMTYSKSGVCIDRWFARRIPLNSWLQRGYHSFITYLIVAAGRCFGAGIARPELFDVRDLSRVVGWAVDRQNEGKMCCITVVCSNAVRIAMAASEMGVSLEKTKFVVHGEPFTESKREAIERVGAAFTLRYSFAPGIFVGPGCARPLYTDEIHVNQYLLAVVSHDSPYVPTDPPVKPLLFTTLHPAAPHFLLNVENGDYATAENRDCGCALEKVGLTLHLHHIRSFEKFTSEGMNYFYGDLYEFFEKALPSEFGGGLGDYQLVEEEDDNGQTRLTLVVHPEVGEVNDAKLLSRLKERLSQGSSANRFQSRVWQDAGTLRVRRETPHASPRGKILPLHISR